MNQPSNFFQDSEFNPHSYSLTPEIAQNLSDLHERMNQVREAYGKPMVITSGLRSEADQARINPSAPKSKHLIGAACDIEDKDGSLNKWCKDNEPLLTSIGLWLEVRQGGWQHFQCLPPKSGHLWFLP